VILAKFLRLHHGWSLDAASKRAGISLSELCLIERKRFLPTDAALNKLADAYGVTPAASLLKEVTLQDLHILNTQVIDVAAGVSRG
jgi:transcriptional regulator with XRE-family HTH domain